MSSAVSKAARSPHLNKLLNLLILYPAYFFLILYRKLLMGRDSSTFSNINQFASSILKPQAPLSYYSAVDFIL